MTTKTVQTTQPAFATRATLDAHITAMGHELVPLGWQDARFDPEAGQTWECDTCGALCTEDADGVDLDDRLLAACTETEWVSYVWRVQP